MRPRAMSERPPDRVILNDYRCTQCGEVAEQWTASPPPQEAPCVACGAPARRLFAAIRLAGVGQNDTSPASRATSSRSPSLCTQYPAVPGLCHMSESAGRMMVAKFTGDNQGVEKELSRQESRARVSPPTMDDVVTHQHYSKSATQSPASHD
jgi:predicted nucleic acid-binding Zn ribbon protein